ncbi:hypothetical protein D1872_316830 [compost metagenome]
MASSSPTTSAAVDDGMSSRMNGVNIVNVAKSTSLNTIPASTNLLANGWKTSERNA